MTPGGTTDPARFLPSSPVPRVASPPPTIRPRPHSSGGHRGGTKSGSSASTSPIHTRAASNGNVAAGAAAAGASFVGDGEFALALPSDEVLQQQEVQAKFVQAVGVRKPNQAPVRPQQQLQQQLQQAQAARRIPLPDRPTGGRFVGHSYGGQLLSFPVEQQLQQQMQQQEQEALQQQQQQQQQHPQRLSRVSSPTPSQQRRPSDAGSGQVSGSRTPLGSQTPGATTSRSSVSVYSNMGNGGGILNIPATPSSSSSSSFSLATPTAASLSRIDPAVMIALTAALFPASAAASHVVGVGAHPPLKQAVKVKLSDKQRILLEKLYRGLLPCVVTLTAASKPVSASALSPSPSQRSQHESGSLPLHSHELPPLESLFAIRTPADLPAAIGELLLRALESEQRAVQDGIAPAASAAVAHAPPAKRAAPNLALVRSNMNLGALEQQQQPQQNANEPRASSPAAAAPLSSSSSAPPGSEHHRRGSLSHAVVEHQIQSPSAYRAHVRHHSANDDLGAAFREDDGASAGADTGMESSRVHAHVVIPARAGGHGNVGTLCKGFTTARPSSAKPTASTTDSSARHTASASTVVPILVPRASAAPEADSLSHSHSQPAPPLALPHHQQSQPQSHQHQHQPRSHQPQLLDERTVLDGVPAHIQSTRAPSPLRERMRAAAAITSQARPLVVQRQSSISRHYNWLFCEFMMFFHSRNKIKTLG